MEATGNPKWGFHQDVNGIHAIGKTESGGTRIVLTEPSVDAAGEPTLEDVRKALIGVYGADFGIRNPTWISRFTDMARQAASYRGRRVLFAGDAAHVHAPMGGQGLNIGVQDAVNLGWKLAQVVNGISSESLLDTYHAERHPVAARVLKNIMAQVALRRPDDRTKAMVETLTEILALDEPRKKLAAEMSGLGVHYDSAQGPIRVFSLLHKARPVLLNFGEPGAFDITPWADRVQSLDVQYSGPWELPVLGSVAAPTAVLVRPDGYVAWIQDGTQSGPEESLSKWFGPASAPE